MQQNVSRRPYNHCRYAGNTGDVWKHILLLEALGPLAKQRQAAFHYMETHAGPGYARLGDNGDWRRGVGRFMDGTASALEHPYFELVLPAMQENFLYKGSWVLVAEWLKRVEHPDFKLTVLEVNADTLKMAASAIRKGALAPWVKLEPKSGYDALQKVDAADFVLIDPPYRSSDGSADDWGRVMDALKRVKAIAQNWMVWYPIFRRQEPDELLAVSGGRTFELLWADDAPGWVMKGCGLAVDEQTYQSLQSKVEWIEGIAQSLGGRLGIGALTAAKTEFSDHVCPPHRTLSYSATYA